MHRRTPRWIVAGNSQERRAPVYSQLSTCCGCSRCRPETEVQGCRTTASLSTAWWRYWRASASTGTLYHTAPWTWHTSPTDYYHDSFFYNSKSHQARKSRIADTWWLSEIANNDYTHAHTEHHFSWQFSTWDSWMPPWLFWARTCCKVSEWARA